VQLLAHHFDFAGGDGRVDGVLGARIDHAFDSNNVFGAEKVGLGVDGRVAIRAEYDLRNAFAVAQVEEEHAAKVAAAVDPAHEDNLFAGVVGAEGSTVMRAAEFAKKVERYLFHV
jgi:hypothetical protein